MTAASAWGAELPHPLPTTSGSMEHLCIQIGWSTESRRLEGVQGLPSHMGDYRDLRDVHSPLDLPPSCVCSMLVLPCSPRQHLMPERVFPLQQLPLAQHPLSSALNMVPAQHQPAQVSDAGSPESSSLVLAHCLKWSRHGWSPAWASCCRLAHRASDLSRVEPRCLKPPGRI